MDGRTIVVKRALLTILMVAWLIPAASGRCKSADRAPFAAENAAGIPASESSANPELAQGVLKEAEYRAGTQSPGIARMQFGNAENNPVVLIDPTGWRVLKKRCLDAIANLNRALANAENDMRKNIEHFPPDARHVKEKEGRITDLADAMGRVAKYCGCDVAAALLARAKAVLDKLNELINAFARAMTSRQFLEALILLLAIVPLLIELSTIVAAMALAAA